MEVGEVAIDAGYFGEPFMLYHLAPLIIGQEQATLRVDTVKETLNKPPQKAAAK